ncbi:MAG: CPBP family intramembrane metalloprotease [Candidatus Diapherotrites archaeon]|nr:CPBP family intramembrane metalloprotease [Candidatus Diapherotrites archaeon]
MYLQSILSFNISMVALDFLFFGVPLAFYFLKRARPLNELGLHARVPVKTVLLEAAGLLVAMLVLTAALGWAASMLGLDDTQPVEEAIQSTVQEGMGWLAYLIVVRVFAEEVFFRGLLTPVLGIGGSALVFGAAHALYGSYLEVMGAALLGLLLAWRYKATKTLWVPVGAHMAYNIITIWSVLAL